MRDDAGYLLDMLLAARDAASFLAGLTWAQFENSRLHQNAVIKAIEIRDHWRSCFEDIAPDPCGAS